jgi:flagellar protein FlgJ
MQISGIGANGVMNNPTLVQTKDMDKGDFAQRLASLTEKAQTAKDDVKLKKTCKDMEAVFLSMMMADMRKTVDKAKLVDDSKEDIMTSMLDDEMTKKMADAGGMGLADMLYQQLHIAAKANKNPQALK